MQEIDFEERRKDIDEDCSIVHSDLCRWMATKTGCHECYLKRLKSDEQREEALEKWKLTLELIPEDLETLFDTDDCQFCKGEAEKADGYAALEMAHPEPYFEKGMFFGIGKKVRTPVGSLLQVQISTCARCRKTFRIADMMQIFFLVGFIAASLILLAIPAFAQSLLNLFEFMPLLFVVIMGVLGYVLGKNATVWYLKKVHKTVKVDLAEIPIVKRLLDKGWFFFQLNNGLPKLSYAKALQYDRIKGRMRGVDGVDAEEIPLDNMNI